MEARLYRIATAFAILASGFCVDAYAASVRTQNFIIEAQSQEFAERTAQLAEQYRRDLALDWLGRELPPWREPCPVRVTYHQHAQGETSFVFDHRGVPGRWNMEVLGPPERILDAVLPHEITHTIFATHFGRPLPRWADEGACTSVEHESERVKHEHNLIRYLKTNQGIAFNKMFAMKEYPSNILPLYAQGYSVARYLILQGGRQKYVKFLEDGMAYNNWNAAVEKHYGYQDLSDLQVTWLDWVRVGSPQDLPSRPGAEVLVSAPPSNGGIPGEDSAPPPAPAGEGPAGGLAATDPASRAAAFGEPSGLAMTPDGASMTVAQGENGAQLGWYVKQREQHLGRVGIDGVQPLPDNRRPQAAPQSAHANAVARNALPPNLAPTPGGVQQLPSTLWSGTAGPTQRLSDARPVPGTQSAGSTGLAPIDPAPLPTYGQGQGGSLLR